MLLFYAIFIKGTNLQFVAVGAKSLIVEHKANLINLLGVKSAYYIEIKLCCYTQDQMPWKD